MNSLFDRRSPADPYVNPESDEDTRARFRAALDRSARLLEQFRRKVNGED